MTWRCCARSSVCCRRVPNTDPANAGVTCPSTNSRSRRSCSLRDARTTRAMRRSERVRQRACAPAPDWASLSQPLLCAVLALLPVECRLRAAEVCRAWRAATRERSAWARLEISYRSLPAGLRDHPERAQALVRAALARSAGSIQALTVSSVAFGPDWRRPLINALIANAASLRELFLEDAERFTPTVLEELLRAAPRLRVLEVGALCVQTCAEALPLLRNEGIFAPLRANALYYDAVVLDGNGDDPGAFRELAAAAATHAPLRSLHFAHAPRLSEPAALEAVADAALAFGVEQVCFISCALQPACVPALARLVRSTSLHTLKVDSFDQNAAALLDEHGALLLGMALRRNCTLHTLHIRHADLWANLAAAAALLAALVAHPSVRVLDLFGNENADDDLHGVAGGLLAALIAADGLHILELGGCELGDVALCQLAAALPRATRLQELSLYSNAFSEECAREALLPAVRDNTSLRSLRLGLLGAGVREEIDDILRARQAALP